MRKFYFTFGTDPRYPFPEKDYVVVNARTMSEAMKVFNKAYPPRIAGTGVCNCAFIYTATDFQKRCRRYYKGVAPIKVLGGIAS